MFVRCSYSPRSNHPSRQLFLSQPQRHHTMKMKMLIISAVLLLLSTSSSSTFFFCSAQQQQTPAACPSSVTTVETCETFCIDSSSSSTNATASSSSFVSFVTEISDWESYQLGGTRCSCTFNFDDGTTMSSSCETAFVLETCDAVNVLSCGAPCNDFCTSLGFVVDECRGGNRNRECGELSVCVVLYVMLCYVFVSSPARQHAVSTLSLRSVPFDA